MELYIIRHAQSTNNAAEMLNPGQRVFDPPLTELGHEQAAALAKYLCDGLNPEGINDALYALDASARQQRGFHLTKLYCSPMHRSLQTTKYIADATGLVPHVWRDIHEHGGMYLEYPDERGIVGFPGKTRAEILNEFPNYVLTDEITDIGWWTGGMESITAAQGRALQVGDDLRYLAQQTPEERIAIVSHGTFINQLLKALLNQLPSRGQWFHHLNTAITRVDFIPERGLAVQYVNRVAHLTPELISG